MNDSNSNERKRGSLPKQAEGQARSEHVSPDTDGSSLYPSASGALGRRGFLSSLAGVTAQLVIDPEFALWVPGARVISIPSNPAWVSYYAQSRLMSNAEALAAQREAMRIPLEQLMWMSSVFWNKMQNTGPVSPIRPSRIPMMPMEARSHA